MYEAMAEQLQHETLECTNAKTDTHKHTHTCSHTLRCFQVYEAMAEQLEHEILGDDTKEEEEDDGEMDEEEKAAIALVSTSRVL